MKEKMVLPFISKKKLNQIFSPANLLEIKKRLFL